MFLVKNKLSSKIKSSLTNNKKSFEIPFSWFVLEVLDLLDKNNFIGGFSFVSSKLPNSNLKPLLRVSLKTTQNNFKGINNFKLISKPSKRVFVNYKTLTFLAQTNNSLILSTQKGLLLSSEALHLKVGGEVLYLLT